MNQTTDCAIIGGGVIGLSIAWELLNRGYSCSVIDQGPIGKGCSWAGAGILPPAKLETARDPIDELRGLSHQLHPLWSQKLRETTGLDNGYRRCGGVYLATSIGEAAALKGQSSYWSEYEIDSQAWSLEDLLRHEPALSRSFAEISLKTVIWTPDEAQLRPPAHLNALVAAGKQLGCRLLDFTTVIDLEPTNNKTWLVRCGNEVVSANYVVLACGAWASTFAAPQYRTPDVYPVRGQAILYQGKPGLLTSIINEGHRYLVPRADGVIYVGSNEEEVGLTEGTTPEVIESLKSWATHWVPELLDAPILRTVSGLRPGSMDGFPHIGKSPKHEGIFVATGHFRSGLHLSCATAVVVADLIAGNESPLRSISLTAAR